MDDLTVILPVYNEKESVERVIKEWATELNKCSVRYHLMVCEDGSTDGTKQVLERIKKQYRLILNQQGTRRGYGNAIVDGLKATVSRYVLCIDSDGQCDPRDFRKFWLYRNQSLVLIGWRTKRADVAQRKVFSFLFKTLFSLLFPLSIHDPSAPFVLCQTTAIIPHLRYLTFLREGFWWGFIGMCMKKDLMVREIPIRHRPRFNGNTQVYTINKIPAIAVKNIIGLILLKLAK